MTDAQKIALQQLQYELGLLQKEKLVSVTQKDWIEEKKQLLSPRRDGRKR